MRPGSEVPVRRSRARRSSGPASTIRTSLPVRTPWVVNARSTEAITASWASRVSIWRAPDQKRSSSSTVVTPTEVSRACGAGSVSTEGRAAMVSTATARARSRSVASSRSRDTDERTALKPVCTVTAFECRIWLGSSTRRPSKVLMPVADRPISTTVPAWSATAIWSPTRKRSRARITMPANMLPSTVWNAMPAAIEMTPIPPKTSTGLTLGKTTVTAAPRARTVRPPATREPNTRAALGLRPPRVSAQVTPEPTRRPRA
ncbi:hypothetical protein MIFL109517_09430 [Micrococcus flavus]